MVGLGEERDEVLEAMQLLRDADVDVLTIGQYLRPTKRHAAVERYVEPGEFAEYEQAGADMGFRFVASGPLVRSSYRAAEVFLTGALAAETNAGELPPMDRYGKKKKLARSDLRGNMHVIRDDGSLDPTRDPGLSIDEVVALYKAMVRTRIVDDRLEKIQRQGRIAFHVGSLGEEAAIIGAAGALRDRDWIVPCYREVGALLWRGYPLQQYVDHMYGNADDPLLGRQMPDHTFSRAHRYLSVSAPIGTQIPHAVGVAMAAKKRGLDECVGVFFRRRCDELERLPRGDELRGGVSGAGVVLCAGTTATRSVCRRNSRPRRAPWRKRQRPTECRQLGSMATTS